MNRQNPIEWLEEIYKSQGEISSEQFIEAKLLFFEYINNLPINILGLSNTHVYIQNGTVIVRPTVNEETDEIKSECEHPDDYRWHIEEKNVTICAKCDKYLES